MKSRILAFSLAICLVLTPIKAWPDEPRATAVQQGEIVPYDGLLLNKAAAASVIGNKRLALEQAKLSCTSKLELQKAMLGHQTKLCEQQSAVVVTTQQRALQEVQKQLAQEKTAMAKMPWFLTGIGCGVIVGVIVAVNVK